MTASGAAVLCVLIAGVVFGSRLVALLSLTCGVLFLSQAQQVSVAGINFFAIRFLEIAAFVRVLARGEFSLARFNGLDWALAGLYAYTTIVYLARASEGAASALALAADAGLCYVACRGLIRHTGDFVAYVRALAFILIPYVFIIALERKSGRPPLSFMSSGMEGIFVRGGVTRCMGSFRNPDLLGTVGATLLPVYIGLAFSSFHRWRALLGAALCLIIVWLSHSGGSLSAAAVALFGWGLWWFRSYMREFRWGLAAMLVMLALVMKAPVWYILDRVSSITGGTGWHRSYLIDVAVRHLGQWWLAGMPIRDTQDWFYYTIGSTGGADITNHYIWFGLMGGLGAVALLILVLVRSFNVVGAAMARARRFGPRGRQAEPVLWGMGVMLAVHSINWLGISYFDQIYVLWLLQLAALSSAATLFRGRWKRPRVRVHVSQPEASSAGRTVESAPLPIGQPACVALA